MNRINKIVSRARGEQSGLRDLMRLTFAGGGVNLVAGAPDFPAPDFLKAAAQSLIAGDCNQYAIPHGCAALRTAIADKYQKDHGRVVDPESMVTITCGATEGLASTLQAIIELGDEVILLDPGYDVGNVVRRGGGVPVYVPLNCEDFSVDASLLERAVTDRTIAIVLNSPHNPTGRVFTESELQVVADLCLRHDLLAITDEVYSHMVYDGAHIPLASLPQMGERTITISSFSKLFTITGWRIGFVLAPAELTAIVRQTHADLTAGAPAPLQEACARGLAVGAQFYTTLSEEYRKRRAHLFAALAAAGLNPLLPQGALFIMADVTHITPDDEWPLVQWLSTEIGVTGVPGSVFFHHRQPRKFIRFTFARSRPTLAEAALRLGRTPTLLPQFQTLQAR